MTNAHRTTLEIKMANVNITGWFDRVVVSHDLLLAPKETRISGTGYRPCTPSTPPHATHR